MKQQFLKGKTGEIRMTAYSSGVAVVPSSALITLKKPDGSELQAQASATVGSDGEMTYSLTTTHTADHDLNYIAEWEFVVNSVTYYEKQLFDIVKSKLSIPITDEDLINELDSLRDANLQVTGTATAATASTFADTVNLKEANDYWNGGTLEILSGTGAGQMRDVTDFVQSTSLLSVSPNWATTPDTTSTYRLVKSFSKKIEQAFEQFEFMLYSKGRRQDLILESAQIRIPLVYRTITNIALDLTDEEGDKWDRLVSVYGERFEKAFSEMKLEYDEDESGTITEEEEARRAVSFEIGRQ